MLMPTLLKTQPFQFVSFLNLYLQVFIIWMNNYPANKSRFKRYHRYLYFQFT